MPDFYFMPCRVSQLSRWGIEKAPLFIFKEGWIAQTDMFPLKRARRGDYTFRAHAWHSLVVNGFYLVAFFCIKAKESNRLSRAL